MDRKRMSTPPEAHVESGLVSGVHAMFERGLMAPEHYKHMMEKHTSVDAGKLKQPQLPELQGLPGLPGASPATTATTRTKTTKTTKTRTKTATASA